MIQWVQDTGSAHVEITSPTATEQRAEDTLKEHHMFMENDATVRRMLVVYVTGRDLHVHTQILTHF